MGLHICLYTKDGEDHPEWDYIRQGNDRNFPSLIDWDKVEDPSFELWEEPEGFIPTDIDALRQRIIDTDWDDKERYLHLIDLLVNTKGSYLYFSY